jgi:hypothetical protein
VARTRLLSRDFDQNVDAAASLVAEHGANTPVSELLRVIAADCPKMQAGGWHDICGVHLPQLAKVRV